MPGGSSRGASGSRTEGPLSGRCVLVTRAAHQASALADPLVAAGAEVLIAPVIETVEPDDWGPADAAIAQLGTYDWIVFTSANAVDRFLGRGGHEVADSLAAGAVRLAVVGSATAERLAESGLRADLVPDDFRAEGLIDAFEAKRVGAGARILLPRAEHAREVLPETLRQRGAVVDVVAVYRTVPAVPDPGIIEQLRDGRVDVITFTSPSTVRHFVAWIEAAGLDAAVVLADAAAASIGEVTTDALTGRGFAVPVTAEPSTAAGLVRAIEAYGEGLARD